MPATSPPRASTLVHPHPRPDQHQGRVLDRVLHHSAVHAARATVAKPFPPPTPPRALPMHKRPHTRTVRFIEQPARAQVLQRQHAETNEEPVEGDSIVSLASAFMFVCDAADVGEVTCVGGLEDKRRSITPTFALLNAQWTSPSRRIRIQRAVGSRSAAASTAISPNAPNAQTSAREDPPPTATAAHLHGHQHSGATSVPRASTLVHPHPRPNQHRGRILKRVLRRLAVRAARAAPPWRSPLVLLSSPS
jgi:hypothetical protein